MIGDARYAEAVAVRLRDQIDAYHASALIYTAAELRLADAMGSESWTVDELAADLGLSPPHLFRFLRVLSTIGVCIEHAGLRFSLSPLGQSLKPGMPSRLYEKALIVVEQYWRPWANLVYSLKTGAPAFDHIFGTDVWDWRRVHADRGAFFDAYLMQDTLEQAASIAPALPISAAEIVADIAGGNGALLAAVLKAHPHAAGILFDRPQTIETARSFSRTHGIEERITFASGNFFENVPIRADLYLLKSVLHDWEDADCLTILRNCRAAMPDHARLLVIERLLPERAADDPAAIMMDMHMMVVTGGKERSLEEHRALLQQTEFVLVKATATDCGLSILEASPA